MICLLAILNCRLCDSIYVPYFKKNEEVHFHDPQVQLNDFWLISLSKWQTQDQEIHPKIKKTLKSYKVKIR